MDAIEAIMTRRSIRKFTTKEVAPETVDKLLRAAMAAPSARNEQPWHFIVVRDKTTLAKIPQVNQHAQMAAEAPLVIVICSDNKLQKANSDYCVLDCCLAGQNILLAAHSLGLGAVWTALYPNEERVRKARELFQIPNDITPLCVIPLGWPAEKKGKEDRFMPDRIHQEQW